MITIIGFVDDIEKLTLENTNFRKVLFTSQHAQIVVMCINPGGAIGEEVHPVTDQFLRIETGVGKLILKDKEFKIGDGTAILIPAGSKHNIINTSKDKNLLLYSIYCPPHHKEGTVHKTRKDAEEDTGDHL